jgi:4a-hydroxytetrahydrobiopterin dehydratase
MAYFFHAKSSRNFPEQNREIMIDLKEKHCTACEEATEPLNAEQIEGFISKLNTKWDVVDNKMLRKEFPFENFKQGMAFAQNVALLAEEEGHHPDMCIHYKSVDIELSTHSINGLSENDFIMAAKIDEL